MSPRSRSVSRPLRLRCPESGFAGDKTNSVVAQPDTDAVTARVNQTCRSLAQVDDGSLESALDRRAGGGGQRQGDGLFHEAMSTVRSRRRHPAATMP